jgi:hypothetical protein
MAFPFSDLLWDEGLADDEGVARREVALIPEGFDLPVAVTLGVYAHNEEPAWLEGLLEALETLL